MKSIMVSGEELSNHLLFFLNELPENLYLGLCEAGGAEGVHGRHLKVAMEWLVGLVSEFDKGLYLETETFNQEEDYRFNDLLNEFLWFL